MPDYAAQRFNMVASQLLANGVTDESVLDAARAVPREAFVPKEKRSVAYADAPIELARGRWLLEPRTFGKMLQLAEIKPSDRVLDVACATGYSTAVLARIARKVVGLEQDADFVRVGSDALRQIGATNASIVQGSFADGCPAEAPFDAIIVNGAIEVRPQILLAQLSENGRLAAITQRDAAGQATLYLKEEGRVGWRFAFDASTPVLAGFRQAAGFVF
ncbi:MAG TPA: protein-L-isoaspartate O-methyltransferase [Rhizomicrobium sp.]|jgi:protein-L-isoaspartate(D-aspartate) O-methyltransferase